MFKPIDQIPPVIQNEIYGTDFLISFFKSILQWTLNEDEFNDVFIYRTINWERKWWDCQYMRGIFSFYKDTITQLITLPFNISILSQDACILLIYFMFSGEKIVSRYLMLEMLCKISQTVKEVNDFFYQQWVNKEIVHNDWKGFSIIERAEISWTMQQVLPISETNPSTLEVNPNPNVTIWEGIMYDANTWILFHEFWTSIQLSEKQKIIFNFLLQFPYKFVSRNDLLDALWDTGEIDDRTIDTHIKRLRNQLAKVWISDKLKTHYGLWYAFQLWDISIDSIQDNEKTHLENGIFFLPNYGWIYINQNLELFTISEIKILQKLLLYPMRIFSRDELIEVILFDSENSDIRQIDAHIKRLRNKLNTILKWLWNRIKSARWEWYYWE